jgi:hypothetical protein
MTTKQVSKDEIQRRLLNRQTDLIGMAEAADWLTCYPDPWAEGALLATLRGMSHLRDVGADASVPRVTVEQVRTAAHMIKNVSLVRLIDAVNKDRAHTLGIVEAAKLKRTTPVSEQHVDRVEQAIRATGYNPLAIPPRVNGLRCIVKQAARKCVGTTMTKSQFNTAWQEGLNDDRIVISKQASDPPPK